MRHRGGREEPEVSAQATADSGKSYTAEQLEAVKKSVRSLCAPFVAVKMLVELADVDIT